MDRNLCFVTVLLQFCDYHCNLFHNNYKCIYILVDRQHFAIAILFIGILDLVNFILPTIHLYSIQIDELPFVSLAKIQKQLDQFE